MTLAMYLYTDRYRQQEMRTLRCAWEVEAPRRGCGFSNGLHMVHAVPGATAAETALRPGGTYHNLFSSLSEGFATRRSMLPDA